MNKSKEETFERVYKPWCLENNKLPSKESPDPIEKKLGMWRYRNNDWKILEEFNSQFNPKEYKSKEKVFKEEYIPWVLKNQRLPNRKSPNPIERKLGQWRNFNRKWEILEEFNSQFGVKRKSKEKVFTEEYKPWCKENNRLPSVSSSDPTEKKLGDWRHTNRNWEVLIEFNSQFDSKLKPKEKVFEEDYKPWCEEYQRLPLTNSSDPIEKKLGYWRNSHRKWGVLRKFNSQFNPKEYKSKEKVFTEKYIPWCKENNRLPSVSSSDSKEKRLGVWRDRNRKWKELIKFNSQFNPKCKPKEKTFEEDYIPWVLENNKLPSKGSSDPIEKRLGQWRSNRNRKWNKLIQFNILFSYSIEGNSKAKELLEKMMH